MNKILFTPPKGEDDLNPVFEIVCDDNNGSICATYYNDLSGEIAITHYDGDEFFFKDDGKLKHHIQYLQEAMKRDQKEAQRILKQKMGLYKKAITLLEKTQTKYKPKKEK